MKPRFRDQLVHDLPTLQGLLELVGRALDEAQASTEDDVSMLLGHAFNLVDKAVDLVNEAKRLDQFD